MKKQNYFDYFNFNLFDSYSQENLHENVKIHRAN